MAVCCIGGVCVPYSALIPLLLWGLKWFLQQLVATGLLPASLQARLQNWMAVGKKSQDCCAGGGSSIREEATVQTSGTVSSTTTSSSCSSGGNPGETITMIDSEEAYQAFQAQTTTTRVIKFTADWCGPCKKIQPVYVNLAATEKLPCGVVDVDELDEIAGDLGVGILPTFVAFDKNKAEKSRYTGSSEAALTEWMKSLSE